MVPVIPDSTKRRRKFDLPLPPLTNGTNGSNQWSQGLPMWARVLGVIGIPGAIAVFLVWQGSTEIPKIVLTQTEIKQQIAVMQSEISTTIAKRNIESQDQVRMLFRICVNTSKTDADRQACFQR